MLRPYDFILTKEDLLFVVKNHEEFDGSIIASPKYAPYRLAKIKFMGKTWQMLGEKWSRINNPLNPSSNIPEEIRHFLSDYKKSEENYIITEKNIKDIFYAKDGIDNLLHQESKKQNITRQNTKKLVNLLGSIVPSYKLGLTGSSLFKGEIDNFSDIDLIVYSSDCYKKISAFLAKTRNPEISFRDKEEWQRFYEQYDVVAPISKEEFARHMITKYDQFFINNIPVSLFAVRSNKDMNLSLLYKNAKIKFEDYIELESRVSDDSESMFLPSFYKIDDKNKYFICNENRAFISQAKTNERVIVGGELGNDSKGKKWIKINVKNGGYLVKK